MGRAFFGSGEVSWSWDVIRIVGGNHLDTLFKVQASQPQGDIVATGFYVTVGVLAAWWAVRRFWRRRRW